MSRQRGNEARLTFGGCWGLEPCCVAIAPWQRGFQPTSCQCHPPSSLKKIQVLKKPQRNPFLWKCLNCFGSATLILSVSQKTWDFFSWNRHLSYHFEPSNLMFQKRRVSFSWKTPSHPHQRSNGMLAMVSRPCACLAAWSLGGSRHYLQVVTLSKGLVEPNIGPKVTSYQ